MARNKRVYRHYEDLEEYHFGMWRIVRGEERAANIRRAAELMRCAVSFKAAMLRAVLEWPMSCEATFTADSVNQIAWLGHAGCCIGANSPEENTRCAWHTLTPAEQDIANRVAQEALDTWHENYRRPGMLDLFSFGGIAYA